MVGWVCVQVLGERLLLRGRPPREMVPFYERAVHIYTSCYVELFGTYKRPRRLFQRLATVKHLVQVRSHRSAHMRSFARRMPRDFESGTESVSCARRRCTRIWRT